MSKKDRSEQVACRLCAGVARHLRGESNRFSAGAEDAIRSFSSCNPFLRGGRTFLRGRRKTLVALEKPPSPAADAAGTERPCRCDLRRSPMPEWASSSSAAAAAALRRDADTTFSVRRVKKLFGLFHSRVGRRTEPGCDPSRSTLRDVARVYVLLPSRSAVPLSSAEGANYHGLECCQP